MKTLQWHALDKGTSSSIEMHCSKVHSCSGYCVASVYRRATSGWLWEEKPSGGRELKVFGQAK